MPLFSSFLAVATRLESLDISVDTFSKTTLVALVHGLPHTMQWLQLSCSMWSGPHSLDILDDNILTILTPADDLSSTCCPALRELILSLTAEACGRLQRVEVQSCTRAMELDISPSLRTFIDAGLIVSLQYKQPQAAIPLSSPWSGLRDEDDPASFSY
ncbi:hypothetical protein DFH07DRAFT_324079 [Mycena maculata]|uniref:Uncharacterized protein n=1 Tax=Mycena maculata TaxID=230809 RepID=A0AAD7P000_9AGAR|nr:hypothetical protein DFH07DRAFT_324079 [Mycena maculata]